MTTIALPEFLISQTNLVQTIYLAWRFGGLWQISDANQDQITIRLFALNVFFLQKLKVHCWSKGSWTGATAALGWAPLHLLPSRGQGIFAWLLISSIVPKHQCEVHISLPIDISVQGRGCLRWQHPDPHIHISICIFTYIFTYNVSYIFTCKLQYDI